MSAKDFEVAIIGGGMCGLLCAYALAKANISVHVFEAAAEFGEVGAGVGIGPNAIRALSRLGVLDAVLLRSDHPSPILRPFAFVSGYGGHEKIYDYPVTEDDKALGIHRAAFLDAVLELVDKDITHVNKRFISLEHPTSRMEHFILHFADGSTHKAHLVIGADGIRSITRKYVAGDTSRLAFSKSVAYRGLLPNSTLVAAGVETDFALRPLCFCGEDKHIITFPIQAGRVINIVAFSTDPRLAFIGELAHPWVESVPKQELLDKFKGWGKDVMTLLESMKDPSRWSIHTVKPCLSSYIGQNIALIGDAAHGMLPHLGAGVGQGFEDVLVLCELLSHPETNLSNLQEVLATYDKVRRPRANMVLEASANAGLIYEGYGKQGYSKNDMQARLEGIWHPVWHHDLMGDIKLAEKNLYEQGTFKQATCH